MTSYYLYITQGPEGEHQFVPVPSHWCVVIAAPAGIQCPLDARQRRSV